MHIGYLYLSRQLLTGEIASFLQPRRVSLVNIVWKPPVIHAAVVPSSRRAQRECNC